MGIVKYTGPVASFHCPTEAEIRSLKVHFSPKQEGSGNPSPENVREIVGWDGATVLKSNKNLLDTSKLSCSHPSSTWNASTETNDIVFSNGELSGIVQEGWRDTTVFSQNTPFQPGTYTLSFDYINGIKNYKWKPVIISSTYSGWYSSYKGSIMADSDSGHKEVTFTADKPFYVALNLNSFDYAVTTARNKLYNIQLELGSTATSYEPCKISTTNYEFGVLGKNKFPLRATNQFLDTSTGWSNTNARDMTTGDVFVNISSNNYWNGRSNSVYGISIGDSFVSYHATNNSYGIGVFVPVSPNTEYTLSHAETAAMTRIGYYDSEGSHLNVNYSFTGTNYTFITTIDTAYILVVFATDSTGTEGDYTVSNIQLELGSTPTSYEPYNPNKTVYGGWVDLISGEVCEEWKSIALESLDWSGSGNRARASNSINLEIPNYTIAPDFIAEKYYAAPYSTQLTSHPSGIALGSAGFIAYYDGETLPNGKMVYKLSESTTYHLAPTSLQTFLGQNNIWSNADYVEVEYDLHETQNILARKQFIIANQPHVVSPAAAPLQNFVTDMAAPVKECKVEFKPVQDLHGYDRPWVGGSGKNLFNINAPEQDPSDTTAINTTLRIFEPNTYCVGTSYSNYFYPTKINSYSVSNNTLTVNSDTGYAVGFAVKAAAETTYFISASITNDGRIGIAYYDSTGQWISGEVNKQNKSFTTPANTDIVVLCFNSPSNQTEVSYSNIQLEVGAATTAYEPWENVCPISGWTELEIYKSAKNLLCDFDGTYYKCYLNKNYNYVASSATVSNGSNQIRFCDINKNEIDYWTVNGLYMDNRQQRNILYLPEKDVYYIRFNNNTADVQVEQGTNATSYEPNLGTVIHITFPSEAGTIYGGYVDLVNGEMVRNWWTNHKDIEADEGTPGGAGTGNDTNYRFIAWNLPSAHLVATNRSSESVC